VASWLSAKPTALLVNVVFVVPVKLSTPSTRLVPSRCHWYVKFVPVAAIDQVMGMPTVAIWFVRSVVMMGRGLTVTVTDAPAVQLLLSVTIRT